MFSLSRVRNRVLGQSQTPLEPRVMLAALSNYDNGVNREHNFDDGNAFFEPGGTEADELLADYSGGTYKPSFDQELFDESGGSRHFAGTELRGGIEFYKEGYAGFDLTIPEGYPTEQNDIIHQWFNWSNTSAWTQVLSIQDNNLYLTHRPAQTRNQKAYLIAEDLPQGEKMEFKLSFEPGSADVSRSRVYLNEVKVAEILDEELGWGHEYDTGDDGYIVEGEGHVGMKMGLYGGGSVGADPEDTNRYLIYDNISNASNDDESGTYSSKMRNVDPVFGNTPEDFDYNPAYTQTPVDPVTREVL